MLVHWTSDFAARWRITKRRKRPQSEPTVLRDTMPGAQDACPMASPRVVLSVNACAMDNLLHGGGGAGIQRRTDFGSLAAAFGADIVDWDVADRSWLGRSLRSRIGFGPVAAVLLFLRRRHYDAIWCFTEIDGLLLALLFKIFHVRRILFIVGNVTLSSRIRLLLKWFRVWTNFTAILLVNSYQASELRRISGVPENKAFVMPYQVDCEYFAGSLERVTADKPYIVAVGLEDRDYPALLEATQGLDVEVRIQAASLWSGKESALSANLRPNGVDGFCTYDQLRHLYAGAALAVVPLRETPYQRGVTALIEAMSMGLSVIVTRTAGMSDIVIDRRKVLRSDTSRNTRGSFARLLAPMRPDLQQSNGFYVGVGDVAALRRSICYLLQERDVALNLGAQAQKFTWELLSVDAYTARAVRLVTAAWRGEAIGPHLILDPSLEGVRNVTSTQALRGPYVTGHGQPLGTLPSQE